VPTARACVRAAASAMVTRRDEASGVRRGATLTGQALPVVYLTVLLLQINRFLLGIAEAPLANSLMTTVNNWFAPQEKGQAAGIFISSAKFGPVLVPPLGATLLWSAVYFHFLRLAQTPHSRRSIRALGATATETCYCQPVVLEHLRAPNEAARFHSGRCGTARFATAFVGTGLLKWQVARLEIKSADPARRPPITCPA
jgi:MFS family permease